MMWWTAPAPGDDLVLAALREIYDGRWERNVGTDGGRTAAF
jgi:hypothetical protein